MQTDKYDPDDFVYTDTNEQCAYIKKDGAVPDCLMRGHEHAQATGRCPSGRTATEEQETGTAEPQR